MSRVAEALFKVGAEHASPSAEPASFPAEADAGRLDPERAGTPIRVPPEAPNRAPATVEPVRGSSSAVSPPSAPVGAFDPEVAEKLANDLGACPATIEEFRKLAATLHRAQGADGMKVVMITSAVAGEGKTLTSVNLALTLADSYQRNVLLIDADLRKPSLHQIFRTQNTDGLIQALRQGKERRAPLVEVSPRLKLLPSGGIVPDPMSLLSHESVQALLSSAAEVFDWVIVDVPPAGFLPDCSLLTASVDAVLVVVGAFDTPYSLTQKAVEAIGRDKILGVVMNRAERTSNASYYYGYDDQ